MSQDEDENPISTGQTAPEELPVDPSAFWRSPPLQPRPEPRELPSALERLGPSPFPKSRFPFLGFLATVYDQVATSVRQAK